MLFATNGLGSISPMLIFSPCADHACEIELVKC